MGRSKYRESRILVRRLCRLPGESRSEFRSKVLRLRRHFEQFNADTSGLCQWLLGVRARDGSADNPESFGTFGDYVLDPGTGSEPTVEKEADRLRRAALDIALGLETKAPSNLPPAVVTAAHDLARSDQHTDTRNPSADRLIGRLKALQPAQRLVLYKAAAEWIVSRYQRAMENWVRQRREWEKEKKEWEHAHPELTPAVRDTYTRLLTELPDPEREGGRGYRRKTLRICPLSRLSENLDNWNL